MTARRLIEQSGGSHGLRDLGALESAVGQPRMSMEMMLVLNGQEIDADVDESEKIILGVASGDVDRAEFLAWLESRVRDR